MNNFKLGILGLMAGLALNLSACGGGSGDSVGNDGQTVTGLTFELKVLQSFLAGAFGAGVANNNNGEAVGISDNGTSIQAARWTLTAVNPLPTPLKPLSDGDYSAAYSINDTGTVVGESEWEAGIVAVVWEAGNTVASVLGTLGGFGFSSAYGINEAGSIVGEEVVDAAGNPVAVFWAGAADGPVNLGTLGGDFSSAYFISNSGLVVGESEVAAGGEVHAALWRPAATVAAYLPPVALAPLDGHIASVAFGIDGSGRVVGESQAADGTVHGVIWTLDGGGVVSSTEDLGEGTSIVAANTGDRGVGSATDGTDTIRGAIWNSGNSADNQVLGAGPSRAYAVNDRTQIVGIAGNQAFAALPQ